MGNSDVTPTRAELLAELIAAIEPTNPGDEWFTAKDIMQERGIGYDRANDWLRKASERGRLEKQKYEGKWYYKVKHE